MLQDDVASGAGAFCFFAWFIQSGEDLEDSFDSLITQVWHDPLPYYNSEMVCLVTKKISRFTKSAVG